MMLFCDPRVMAVCPNKGTCSAGERPTFAEGSECDLHNQRVLGQLYAPIGDCTGCRWEGRKRPQRCNCCRRNIYLKDGYTPGRNDNA